MTTSSSMLPSPIDWHNLIYAGRDLLNPQRSGNPPTDEHIRRAVSTAYYATFHALNASNADCLVGTPHDETSAKEWTRIYRGPSHIQAKKQLEDHRKEFSTAAQIFAETFGDLQNLRHSADYDPNAGFTKYEATVCLDEAEISIIDFLQVDQDERTKIAELMPIMER